MLIFPRMSKLMKRFSDAIVEGDLSQFQLQGGGLFRKWVRNTFVRKLAFARSGVLCFTKLPRLVLNTGMRLRVCPLCVLGHCGPLCDHTNPQNPSTCWPQKPHEYRQRLDARIFTSIDDVAPSLPIRQDLLSFMHW